jgi:TonB family protein
MKTPIKKALVSGTIFLATLGASPALAAKAPTWALLRVNVSAAGDLEGIRLRYASGNRSFDRTALQAVSRMVFVPASHIDGPAGFDYLILQDARGRHARVVPALAGYHGSEHPPVRVVPGRDV